MLPTRYTFGHINCLSSNEGDVVLDPFCGCGTTIAAAQKLNRQWIGIDVTHLSVGLMKLRLKDSFGMLPGARIGARTLLSASVRKDADRRGDNSIREKPGSITPEEPALRTGVSALPTSYRVIGQPEDLDGARELALQDRYGFQWWILPLIGARAFGAEKGFYHSPGRNKDYPRLQILTVEDLLAGKTVDLPPNLQTFKQAEKVVAENRDQGMLGFD